ncbi:hypothetical protein PACTADRAFT_50415, partial [Pachysolen tannophilus NRRL Y-2460]
MSDKEDILEESSSSSLGGKVIKTVKSFFPILLKYFFGLGLIFVLQFSKTFIFIDDFKFKNEILNCILAKLFDLDNPTFSIAYSWIFAVQTVLIDIHLHEHFIARGYEDDVIKRKKLIFRLFTIGAGMSFTYKILNGQCEQSLM